MKTNYQIKKLDQIVDFLGGLWVGKKEPFKKVKVLRNTNFRNTGLLDYSNVAELLVENKQLESRLLERGDIVLEKSGGGPDQPVGRVVYFDNQDNYSFSNFTCRLRIKNKNEVYSRFLWLFLFQQYVSGVTEKIQKQTTGIRNLIMPEYKELGIPLPPLSEQKRIVKILDKKMGKIAEAKKLREEALADTEKILSQTLREIFEEGKKKGWEEKTIGDIAIQIKSGFACGKQNEVSDGIVHLRTHNISLGGQLNLDKIVRIPKSFVDTNVFTLKKDDLIFNNTNSVELVGKTILIKEDLAYAFSNHLTRIRFDKKQIISSWILYVFQKYWADKLFERMCTRWIGQAGINQTSLSKLKILVPPLPEQQKIVKQLDELYAKIRQAVELQKSQLDDLKKLEKAYLREAFNGKLV